MVTTRIANEADAPDLLALFQQLGYSVDLDDLRALLREDNPYRYTLVALVEEQLSGVIVVNLIEPMHEKGRWGLISALVIDESCRGRELAESCCLTRSELPLLGVVHRLNSPAVNGGNRRISFTKIMVTGKPESVS